MLVLEEILDYDSLLLSSHVLGTEIRRGANLTLSKELRWAKVWLVCLLHHDLVGAGSTQRDCCVIEGLESCSCTLLPLVSTDSSLCGKCDVRVLQVSDLVNRLNWGDNWSSLPLAWLANLWFDHVNALTRLRMPLRQPLACCHPTCICGGCCCAGEFPRMCRLQSLHSSLLSVMTTVWYNALIHCIRCSF